MTLGARTFKTWSREEISNACKLYLVTSLEWTGRSTLGACVAEAIVGGVTMVQLRQKFAPTFKLAKMARELAPVCRVANAPLVVNDNLEVAKIAGVDGVHLGQSDITCEQARSELGSNAIVGVTVASVEEALKAQDDGATYLNVGPVYKMRNDPERPIITFEAVREVALAVDLPIVVFGGLNAQNIHEIKGLGVDGAAFMSSILSASDIERAASTLKSELDRFLAKRS